ncbi:MAG: RNA-directed DNA polymerase [Christensenellaceae bacterium]|jgi:hypothetical protein
MEIKRAIKLSIENIKKEGLTDIFDRPFEIDLLENAFFVKKLEKNIEKSISLANLEISNIAHVLLPKNTAFSFRKCALIQPLDTLKYTALVLSIADIIEKKRIPLRHKRVFSYRFKPTQGYLFNNNYNITAFRNNTSKRVKKRGVNFVVTCDVSNFYDRINLHRLENTLLSMECDRVHVKLLNDLLMTWSERDSYGLPVGSNASRILAEASLIGVDNYLQSMGVDFIRFVDDYRFFAPTAKMAHYWMTILIERLEQEGLSINTAKTSINDTVAYEKKIEKSKESVVNNEVNSLNVIEKNGEIEKLFENKQKMRATIRAGYGGTVPTRFRELSIREKENLEKEDFSIIYKSLHVDKLIKPEDFIKAIKVCVAQNLYEEIVNLLPLLENFLQITPYYVDVLIKNAVHFSEKQKREVRDFFRRELTKKEYIPEYLVLAYVRLLGTEDFADKEVLFKCFRNLKRNSGVYEGRAILDSICKLINGLNDRERVIEIRKSFQRADLWEKRQITNIVKRVLNSEEFRPWAKTIKQLNPGDMFLLEIIEPSKDKRKRRKKNSR